MYLYNYYNGYLTLSNARWCTKTLKLDPFEDFVGTDPVISYVGIRGDEDREGYISKKTNIQSIFPFRKNIWSLREQKIVNYHWDDRKKYLKDYHENNNKKIPLQSSVGIINGLWANSLGQGGIIPIEAQFFPSTSYMELKLTGLQGDVMKESMTVAKTLATSLIESNTICEINTQIEKTKLQGIHIHCPEGAVPKDGPSAGTAITCTLYSLLTGKKIKNTIAITGEINLQGYITAIGGLDLKILGGLKGGVTEFIFPKENEKDYKTFVDKYKDKDLLNSIKFHSVENIHQVLNLIFEE